MRTVKWNPFLSGLCVVLGGMLLWTGAARADVSSTNPAAILVFPKLVVDTTAIPPTDTIIQITNTADNPVNVRCFYVNANGHCSDNFLVCNPNGDPAGNPCGSFGSCVAGWNETDFAFRLTAHQPISWVVSQGLSDLPLSSIPSGNGQFNSGSVPPAPENPMLGELKCVEVGDD